MKQHFGYAQSPWVANVLIASAAFRTWSTSLCVQHCLGPSDALNNLVLPIALWMHAIIFSLLYRWWKEDPGSHVTYLGSSRRKIWTLNCGSKAMHLSLSHTFLDWHGDLKILQLEVGFHTIFILESPSSKISRLLSCKTSEGLFYTGIHLWSVRDIWFAAFPQIIWAWKCFPSNFSWD